jgi:hypothetical protein
MVDVTEHSKHASRRWVKNVHSRSQRMRMSQKGNKRSSLGVASSPFRRQYFFMKIYGPNATLLIYNSSIETYSVNAEITIVEDHSVSSSYHTTYCRCRRVSNRACTTGSRLTCYHLSYSAPLTHIKRVKSKYDKCEPNSRNFIKPAIHCAHCFFEVRHSFSKQTIKCENDLS